MKSWGERLHPFIGDRRRLLVRISLIAVGVGVVFGSMQNCSKAKLQVLPLPLKMPTRNITARICPQPKLESINNAKFIFVVDMSRSNLGDWVRRTEGSFWNKNVATDLNGQRFDALDGFIQDVASTGNGNQFSVISFSNQAGRPALGSTGTTFDCNPAFGDAATARNALGELKTLNTKEYTDIYQKYESAPWGTFTPDPAYDQRIMRATSYGKALECTQNLLQKDLAANQGRASTYIMVFVTDGNPQDEESTGCETQPTAQRPACYMNEVTTKTRTLVQSAVFMNSTMRVQPIFYGAAPPPPAVLTQMAREGRVTDAISVANVDQLASILGSLVSQPNFVDFKIDFATVTNLNARLFAGKLEADTDADGVIDSKEFDMGYSSTNDRSNNAGLLDGVCESLGGRSKCAEALKGTNCSSNEVQFGNNLGFSDCDIRALALRSIEQNPDYGVDTDHDGVPDFLELTKTLNLFKDDMTEDQDKDGFSNRAELLRGSNPGDPDANLDEELQVRFTQTREPASVACSTGEWVMNITKAPSVEVPMFTQSLRGKAGQSQPRGFLDLSHGTDENVFLITYTLRPQNSSVMPTQTWGATVRVPHKQLEFVKTLTDLDFVLIGETK